MKKLILAALACMSLLCTPIYASNIIMPDNDDICIPGKPCAYDGWAKTESGIHQLKIQVYSMNGSYLARFKVGNQVHEMLAIRYAPCKYYFNWDNKKYYFEM